VQQDLDRAFRVIAANDDSGQNALLPGAVHETVDPALVTLEPVPLAIAGYRDEGLKVTKMIVRDAVDLSGKRGMPVILVAKAKPGRDPDAAEQSTALRRFYRHLPLRGVLFPGAVGVRCRSTVGN